MATSRGRVCQPSAQQSGTEQTNKQNKQNKPCKPGCRWALRHFRELLLGYNIHVYTDHDAVTEIFKAPISLENSLAGNSQFRNSLQPFRTSREKRI